MSNQNPLSYNGSGIVAMVGKNCVAVGTDTRLGVGFQTVATNSQKVFLMQDDILLCITGLASDIQTFYKKMRLKLNMYRLRENRDMKARTFASLVGTTLYEHRFGPFFIFPVVVGLQDGKPVICGYDYIGTQADTEGFITIGTAGENFLPLCESYFKEGLEAEELEDIVSNVLVSGCDRDILSGLGGQVYLMTEEKVTIKCLKTKMV